MEDLSNIIKILGANISTYDQDKAIEIQKKKQEAKIKNLIDSKNKVKIEELNKIFEEKVQIVEDAFDIKIKSFLASLKNFSHLKFLGDFINFNHKYHQDYLMKMHKCKEFHCIECLKEKLEVNECAHGFQFTLYEQYRIDEIVKQIEFINDSYYIYHKCNICRKKFDASDLLERDCNCTICNECTINRFDKNENFCKICGIEITEDIIRVLSNDEN